MARTARPRRTACRTRPPGTPRLAPPPGPRPARAGRPRAGSGSNTRLHALELGQRGVVGEQDALVDQRPERRQDARDDGASADVEQRLVDAAEARRAPAREDQRAARLCGQAARVRRVPHWPQNTWLVGLTVAHDGHLFSTSTVGTAAAAAIAPPGSGPAGERRGGAWRRRRVLVRGRLAEFADALAQGAADLGQPTCAEDNDHDDQNDDEFPGAEASACVRFLSSYCVLGAPC